jgi:hypothetical protein
MYIQYCDGWQNTVTNVYCIINNFNTTKVCYRITIVPGLSVTTLELVGSKRQ